jgi:hypothetical protein
VDDQVSSGLPEGLLFSGSLNDDRERSEVQGLPKFGIIGVTVDDPASFSKVVLYLCQVRVQAHRSFVPLAEGCVSRRADATVTYTGPGVDLEHLPHMLIAFTEPGRTRESGVRASASPSPATFPRPERRPQGRERQGRRDRIPVHLAHRMMQTAFRFVLV